jgi:alpha-tubulin suppressor-like RCC1 family protein
MGAAVLVLAGCGEQESTASSPVVASVTVAPSTVAVLLGLTVQLAATTKDAVGNELTGRAVTWASSSPAVASVSAAGLVTGRAGGAATITATSEGESGSAAITVSVLSFTAVSVGGFFTHTCGLTTGGTAYCWGSNGFGELGNPGTHSSIPVAVAGGLTFVAVSAGGSHTCGLTPNGAAYCWGLNDYGGLGDGTTTIKSTPVAVVGGLTFAALSAGSVHTCGLTPNGAAYCWGRNFDGQVGDGSTIDSNTPVAVAGGLSFVALSGGDFYTCGLTTSGTVYCWGYNGFGQLGNGSTQSSPTPVAVAGGLTFAAVSAGNHHTCGLAPNGAAYCWGDNADGALGNGTASGPEECTSDFFGTAPCSTVPVAVSGALAFATVSAANGAVGFSHTCGVTTSGAAYCWGWAADAQLGNGSTTGLEGCFLSGDTCTTRPVAVVGGLSFDMVSGGDASTCGVTSSGVAYCWGWNPEGLGDGSTEASSVPVKVAGQP